MTKQLTKHTKILLAYQYSNMKEVTPKRLTKVLSVTPETHLKAHKRKLDLKPKGIKDIDSLIIHLLEVEREVNRKK